MLNALNEQINAEIWSAYLYLSMSMDAESKSWEGVAHWFYRQWHEELEHSRRFQCFINNCGAKVLLKPIAKVPTEWSSTTEMFKIALAHEKDVTRMIHDLYDLAVKESDYESINCLQWFVTEQIEEEKSVCDILRLYTSAGNDFHTLLCLDQRLLARE